MNTINLNTVGERGFLSRLLPRLQRAHRRFIVPPGDDAAVLRHSGSAVLSIDGLTEGTHFRMSWRNRCEKYFGSRFGRALGWKLLGSALSDLASMGQTSNRWVMIYLGAPPSTSVRFLDDLFQGVQEKAKQSSCLIVGGDTVRSAELTLVAAVGATLGSKPLMRSGACPGDLLCVAGHLGEAALGLRVLEQKKPTLSFNEQKKVVRTFFNVQPLFNVGEILARTPGVSACIDLSDPLKESIELLCGASRCGASIEVEAIPISNLFRKVVDPRWVLTQSGEDYGLVFTATPMAVKRLRKMMSLGIIGQILPRSFGVVYRYQNQPYFPPSGFGHYGTR